jgi:hypothetical protein
MRQTLIDVPALAAAEPAARGAAREQRFVDEVMAARMPLLPARALGCAANPTPAPLCLLLHDDRARDDSIAMSDIANARLHEIAAAQLAVDRQIEQRELALAIARLEANPYRPNLPEFERRFLPDQLSLVPGIAAARFND